MKVAVLQPSYLPWIGVISLINQVDMFIFYDDVQFEAQSWQQRNRIKTANGVQWLTVPIVRNFGQKINEVEINYQKRWQKDHWLSISQSYSKAPYFNEYKDFWEEFYQIRFLMLSDLNEYVTRRLVDGFNLKIPQYKNSSDFKLEGAKTDRLINLLKQVNATEYLTTEGARGYIEPNKFKEAGIKLTWFEYKPKPYLQQYGEFVGYLSSIDLLFNKGEESVAYI